MVSQLRTTWLSLATGDRNGKAFLSSLQILISQFGEAITGNGTRRLNQNCGQDGRAVLSLEQTLRKHVLPTEFFSILLTVWVGLVQTCACLNNPLVVDFRW